MILNAIIKDTSLGFDGAIFTFTLCLDVQDGYGVVLGGYALDEYIKKHKKRIVQPLGAEAIQRILEIVGVKNWEELKGKYLRVEFNGLGSSISKIGNIMKDDWIDFATFFKGENK